MLGILYRAFIIRILYERNNLQTGLNCPFLDSGQGIVQNWTNRMEMSEQQSEMKSILAVWLSFLSAYGKIMHNEAIMGGLSMAVPQQDIRVTKTHKALAESLMNLLEKKAFQKITVNDICQNAMVSRSTFYLHFEDKYQLFLFCLQTENEQLKEVAKEKGPRELLHSVLVAVKEREKAYRNLLMADIDMELLRMFQAQFYIFFLEMIAESEAQGAEFPGPIPMLARYYASGLAGIMLWWIESGFAYSIEEMVVCIYNLLSDIMPE